MADIYRDISVDLTALYTVNRLTYSDPNPPTIVSLFTVNSLTYSLLISDPISLQPLQIINKLSGSMYDFHIGSAIVAWSDIGNMDFSETRQNIAGKVYMRWQGQVWHTQKLGSNVIVYGDGGITVMQPSEQYFGFHDISIPGILCKTSVAGSDNVHYFVNIKHELCMLKGMEIKRLGFTRYLKDMGDLVSLSYIEASDELFISSPTHTLKYSDGILRESYDQVVEVIEINNSFVATSDSNTNTIVENFQTLPISYPSDITISSVQVPSNCICSVETYRKLNKQSSWALVKTSSTNSLGHASVNITGKDFKFVVKPISWTSSSIIEGLTIYFKRTDKRFGKAIDVAYLERTY